MGPALAISAHNNLCEFLLSTQSLNCWSPSPQRQVCPLNAGLNSGASALSKVHHLPLSCGSKDGDPIRQEIPLRDAWCTGYPRESHPPAATGGHR